MYFRRYDSSNSDCSFSDFNTLVLVEPIPPIFNIYSLYMTKNQHVTDIPLETAFAGA